MIFFVSGILFLSGLFMLLTRKDMIGALLGVEFMLNAPAMNFAFLSTEGGTIDGYVMVVFIIALAALETVVALTVVFSIRRLYGTIEIDRASSLKG
ncbi:MAG: NADH-quinone oxidoreductase subunit NuoK [Leptonema illini]|jgi:NADH-quinone oxidoreductase subunit K|uniref:NADH-quinone oxidoreductase subunit K n=1 Tax=Leptonema illini TaxID=183 RepID=A0A833M040_9LEPT|nr:MAG: NADH-quinone oxidoreductase subunit NuoK [Leptonema illini]